MRQALDQEVPLHQEHGLDLPAHLPEGVAEVGLQRRRIGVVGAGREFGLGFAAAGDQAGEEDQGEVGVELLLDASLAAASELGAEVLRRFVEFLN